MNEKFSFSKRSGGRNSVVECELPKLDVAGSNPVARFYFHHCAKARSHPS